MPVRGRHARDDISHETLIGGQRRAHGRHRPDMVSRIPGNKAAPSANARTARFPAAALDVRIPDVPAADPYYRGLVIYPAFYSIYLSMLNKAQTRFIGLGNFRFLLSRDVFWMVVQQTSSLRAARSSSKR